VAEQLPPPVPPPPIPAPAPQPIAPQPLLSSETKLDPVTPAKPSVDRSTRTIPAMHGVVLRPPTSATKPVPTTPPAPMKNIDELMAEADPVRTLSQTGSIRLMKRTAPDYGTPKNTDSAPAETAPAPVAASLPTVPTPPPHTIAPTGITAPPPTQVNPPVIEAKKADPVPAPEASTAPVPDDDDSPFILKPITPAPPAEAQASQAPTPPPAPARSLLPFSSIFRRKAKMTDVARIVLPPKREETDSAHPPTEASPTVVPPAFPVAAMTARASKSIAENNESKKIVPEEKPATPVEPATKEFPPAQAATASPSTVPTNGTAPISAETPTPKVPEQMVFATPSSVENKPITSPTDIPKVDPEAHKPSPAEASLPKIDPEAHKPTPHPAQVSSEVVSKSAPTAEKREFHLANGEHVVGVVLSETPEAVYLEHGSLGVLTIPRAQIAKRLVEIILINGDRIVGDVMAETADTLYVRHSSLGMLTVPRAHRSTRVVEAVLKDGDRIVGEILSETDTFTVIRSATLGTITVPHNKVSMLNRKLEQIELKALPPASPELKDKPTN
jgi:RNase P/RNase MRP subunit p29